MTGSAAPFASRVCAGMERSGLTLRRLCREAGLDPSFLSKVLAGKRSPPWDEAALRRLAGVLGLDAAELIVAAGRIPAEWESLQRDPEVFGAVRRLIGGRPEPRVVGAGAPLPRGAAGGRWGERSRPPSPAPASRRDIAEELL